MATNSSPSYSRRLARITTTTAWNNLDAARRSAIIDDIEAHDSESELSAASRAVIRQARAELRDRG